MTAILLRLISERCRPLTPVPKKTEILKTRAFCQCMSESDLESNALLVSRSQAFLQQHCWDEGECGIPGGPQSHHPPRESPGATPQGLASGSIGDFQSRSKKAPSVGV